MAIKRTAILSYSLMALGMILAAVMMIAFLKFFFSWDVGEFNDWAKTR